MSYSRLRCQLDTCLTTFPKLSSSLWQLNPFPEKWHHKENLCKCIFFQGTLLTSRMQGEKKNSWTHHPRGKLNNIWSPKHKIVKEHGVSNFHPDIFKSTYRVSIRNQWRISEYCKEIASIHSPFLSAKESLTEISYRNNSAYYCQWKLWVHTLKKIFGQSLFAAITIYIQIYPSGIYRAAQIYPVVTKKNLVQCSTHPGLTAGLCKMQFGWLQVFQGHSGAFSYVAILSKLEQICSSMLL